MTRHFALVPLLALLAMPLACKKAGAGVEETGSHQKTKDEALQVFEKHRATYIKCEKLKSEMEAQTAKEAKSGVAPPMSAEYSACYTEYWKDVKKDMGPFDQAAADEWYSEWRQGVKIE